MISYTSSARMFINSFHPGSTAQDVNTIIVGGGGSVITIIIVVSFLSCLMKMKMMVNAISADGDAYQYY